MKHILPFIICILCSFANANAQELARVESKKFNSPDFPFEREILIYTPQNYDEMTQSELDVVYVFDSQWRSHFALVHSLLDEIQNEDCDKLPFIVVGITSPNNLAPDYQRSNDFTPVPETFTPQTPFYGNSGNFKKFLKETVIPYINRNYRSSGHTLAIGHSLSASFILDALASDNMFDDYIAISPNLEYDSCRFAKSLINHDFNNGKPGSFFLSMANESAETGWGDNWRKAWDSTKEKLENTEFQDNVRMIIKEYPEYSHMRSYAAVLTDALPIYAMYRQSERICDSRTYPVHIELTGASIEGDVYVTGNQDALANWNPKGVKMTRINDTTYSIDLNLKLPAEYKFTQGSWENQIWISNSYPMNQRIHTPANATKKYNAD